MPFFERILTFFDRFLVVNGGILTAWEIEYSDINRPTGIYTCRSFCIHEKGTEMSTIDVFCAHTEMADIESVIPNPRNPNQHDKKQIELLAKIIKAQGWRVPITVSNRSGYVVRGHGRLMAAQLLGLDTVPVDRQDYASEAEEWADLVADNRLAELSTVDKELLGQLLAEMDDMAVLSGYTDDEIDILIGTAAKSEVGEDGFDAAEAEASIKTPITLRGDIWELGNHRLMCGDSTDIADVKSLLGGLSDMIFTDPPYNVAYNGKTEDRLTIINDAMSPDEFYDFLSAAFAAMYDGLKPGGAIYVCHADGVGNEFRRAYIASGLLLKQVLIWVKNTFVIGRQDYQWRHEPILYGWKPGSSHKFYGGRKQSTVWDDNLPLEIEKQESGGYLLHFNTDVEHVVVGVPSFNVLHNDTDALDTVWRVDKPLRNGEHPTMKPIALCARAIQNSSQRGDIVFDPFGGSGSTLIACEQTKRRCRTMELDPKYCDVIVQRYSELMGTNDGIYVVRGDRHIAYKDLI